MSQSVMGVRVALRDLVITPLFPDAETTMGDPGQYQPGEIVALGQVRAPVLRPTGGSNRTREVETEHDIIISVYRDGGPEVQEAADAMALSMYQQIEDYFRVPAGVQQETLGGSCREAWVTSVTLDSAIAWEDTGSEVVAAGRTSTATVTVQANIRRP